ncbi:MAG: pitrilysin family protein [Candidatus Krumholzibacteria bacterium]|jgi:predicted Zn-dependent peptidase|nr:pitrilysin family protein [Candidatus Krumholzibacteria bacterium]MDP6668730.1 pitrilysin family protein [Candidatus Krumholzibacteria bacterium]MDP6797218.1 pitrilysin family protein [Candidatus Krumholzibacteria bacterium]MDP7021191.1 pitrilysin family protein [Candidatus Krumholzibacteria bacterium]
MNPKLYAIQEDRKKVALPGGATLLSQTLPSALSVSMGVWIRSGSRHEEGRLQGISHFLEHMVFKGSRNRSAFEIASCLDRLGGQLDAFTSKESTCFSARVLAEHFDTAIDLLSDLLHNALLEPEMLELEKMVVVEEIRGVTDDPNDWIHDLASEEIFGEHPLAQPILGNEESVLSFSAEDVRQWMKKRYSADRLVIAVAGPLTHEEVFSRVQDHFPRTAAGDVDRDFPSPSKPHKSFRHVSRDLKQQHLWLGRRGMSFHDPRRYGMFLLSTILGGSMSSRLFQEIRERSGLAYSVYSHADFASDTGTLGTSMAVSPKRRKEALGRTLDEFQKLAREGCGEQELEDAKAQLKGSLLLSMESIPGRMARLARNELSYGRFLELEEIVEGVDSVQAGTLQELAEEFLDPESLSLVSIGPNEERSPF